MEQKRIELTIDGKRYPCYSTMGALLRFHDTTGREADRISGVSDMIVYLWCCVVSACRREGIDFSLPLQDFADRVDESEMHSWLSSVQSSGASSASSDEKKIEHRGLLRFRAGLCRLVS